MKTEYEDQQITQLFNTQADAISPDAISTDAIVGRGRARKRQRSAALTVVGVLAASGVAYGSYRALQPGSSQLQVSATSDQPGGSQASTSTATAPSESAPVEPSSSDLAEADQTMESDQTIETDLGEMYPDVEIPAPYRDGFLMMTVVPLDGDLEAEASTVSFGFTTDGIDAEPIGTSLDVVGSPSLVVRGDTVLVYAADGENNTLHLYWSDDLTTWSDEPIDIGSVGKADLLTPAMAELVEVQIYPGTVVTNGTNWVAGLIVSFDPSDELMQELDPSGNGWGSFTSQGLRLTDGNGKDRLIGPDELGVSAEDLAVFDEVEFSVNFDFVAGRRGEPGVSAPADGVGPNQWVVDFGDGFASIDTESQLIVSTDGVSWSPLTVDLPAGERLLTVSQLDSDLLLLSTSEAGVKSYRVAADGSATFLSDVPVTAGMSLLPSSLPGQPIFTAIDQTDLGSSFVMKTSDYEVTIDAGVPGQANTDEMHYVIVDRATGEIVAENTRTAGDWVYGEEVDGEFVVVFTDADGRPDVLIPVAELDAAENEAMEAETDSVPSSDDVSDPSDTDTGSGIALFATADGVHWYSESDENTSFVAVNENKLLVARYVDDVETFEVVDLSTAAAEQPE